MINNLNIEQMATFHSYKARKFAPMGYFTGNSLNQNVETQYCGT